MMIAGGGTGGHLYPGLALAREFERRVAGVKIVFVGTAKGLESRIIPREGYEIRMIRIRGLMGMGILRKLRTLFQLPYSLVQSFVLLREWKPVLVIGVGGYASGPVVLMAGLLGIPRVLLEPNADPGWTNHLLSPLAHRIFVSYEQTRHFFKNTDRVRVFGNPIRKEIQGCPKRSKGTGVAWTLLVMGGSQGAYTINKAMVDALGPLDSFKGRLHVIHQTGEKDYEWVQEAYRENEFSATVMPFLTDIWEAYTASDLVISRSGATTVAELGVCGRPSILIPFPHAIHGHQETNANMLVKAGAARMIRDSELTGAVLASNIHSLLVDPQELEEMARNSKAQGRPKATENIVNECLELVEQNRVNP